MDVRRGERFGLVLVAIAIAAAALDVPATAGTAVPAAQTARTCRPPAYPGSGYFTSLTVKGVSCTTGRRVTLAHYRCRTRSGPRGRCHQHVLGYSCTERRNSIP